MQPEDVFCRRTLLKTAAAGVAFSGWSKSSADSKDEPLKVAGSQLFLDDTVIARMQGLKRRLHAPRKTGLIHEADGTPWDRGGVISVVRDRAGRFHMTYYLHYWDPSVRDLHPSIGNDKAHWFRMPVGYAASEDGVRWSKPVLRRINGPTGFRRAPQSKWKDGQFEEPIAMSLENNLGCPIYSLRDIGTFGGVSDPKRRYLVNVIDKDDDHAFARIREAGLYFAEDVPEFHTGPDWRKRMQVIWEGAHGGPRGASVRPAGYDEQARCWFEVSQSQFGGFQSRGGRDIARWTSQDLLRWSDEELVLPIARDESRDPADYVEYMDITANRVGDVWLGYLLIFHGDRTDPQGEMPTQKGVWRKGYTDVRLVMSRDAGKTWQRVSGKDVWLAPHTEEDGYDRLLGMTFAPVRVGEEMWLYYGCWDGDHLSWNRDGTTYYSDRARIWRTARATLRWNGYVSLAAEDAGEITTKPLAAPGGSLTVNAAAEAGEIRVEAQDPRGAALPGFAASDCAPLRGTGTAQPVRWTGGTSWRGVAGDRPIRLRFVVRKANLYGFDVMG